jgi:hypothetical protein
MSDTRKYQISIQDPDGFKLAFNRGLEMAAQIADSWANEAEAYGGNGGEGYRNLARSIRSKQR